MKKTYIQPQATIFTARVEKGYQCSSNNSFLVGSEGVSDNGYIGFGSGGNNNDGNMEGINDNGYVYF